MSSSVSLDTKWCGAYFAVPLLTKHCLSSFGLKAMVTSTNLSTLCLCDHAGSAANHRHAQNTSQEIAE